MLVVFNASQELDTRQLRELVDAEVQRYLRPDQLIIISRAQTICAAQLALADEQARTTLLERVGEGCHAELWSFNGRGKAECTEVIQDGPFRISPGAGGDRPPGRHEDL